MQRRALTIVGFWVFMLATSLAGLSAPKSNAHLSADGKRLLVMVSLAVEYEKRFPTTFVMPDGRALILNHTFAKSGLYDSATLAPIWQVDWASLEGDIFWSTDMSDVVRVNRFGINSTWALEFFHDGSLTRSYACSELLTGLKNPIFLPFKSWDWHVAWYDDYGLVNTQLSVSTARRRLTLNGIE